MKRVMRGEERKRGIIFIKSAGTFFMAFIDSCKWWQLSWLRCAAFSGQDSPFKFQGAWDAFTRRRGAGVLRGGSHN